MYSNRQAITTPFQTLSPKNLLTNLNPLNCVLCASSEIHNTPSIHELYNLDFFVSWKIDSVTQRGDFIEFLVIICGRNYTAD